MSCQSFLCSQHPHWKSVLKIDSRGKARGGSCSPPCYAIPCTISPCSLILSSPPHLPGGDPGLGLGPLDGGRLGIVWQPADSGQHSGLINCHPGSLLVQCELRRAVGWLQQSIPSTSFSSSPPPVTEFKFDIRFIIFGERKSFTPFLTGIKGNNAKEVNIDY